MNGDDLLRAAAITHISALTNRHGPLSWAQIEEGFEFRGQRVHLASKAIGIFKPAQLRSGALSIRTAVPRKGRIPRYDDRFNEGAEHFSYRFQKEGPEASDNQLARECMLHRWPVIYFFGIAPAVYDALICQIVSEDRSAETFHVAPISEAMVAESSVLRSAARLPIERRYAMVSAKKRLHQDRFRFAVLEAYDSRCAICRLRHPELLDAAHIVEDGDVLGEARVPNGLALCKLHHAAFDRNFIGITPDLEIRLRPELLIEKDGPMLEHGLRAFNRTRLTVPDHAADRPDRMLLEQRWKEFAA